MRWQTNQAKWMDSLTFLPLSVSSFQVGRPSLLYIYTLQASSSLCVGCIPQIHVVQCIPQIHVDFILPCHSLCQLLYRLFLYSSFNFTVWRFVTQCISSECKGVRNGIKKKSLHMWKESWKKGGYLAPGKAAPARQEAWTNTIGDRLSWLVQRWMDRHSSMIPSFIISLIGQC